MEHADVVSHMTPGAAQYGGPVKGEIKMEDLVFSCQLCSVSCDGGDEEWDRIV